MDQLLVLIGEIIHFETTILVTQMGTIKPNLAWLGISKARKGESDQIGFGPV